MRSNAERTPTVHSAIVATQLRQRDIGEVLIGIVLPIVAIKLCRIHNISHFQKKINSLDQLFLPLVLWPVRRLCKRAATTRHKTTNRKAPKKQSGDENNAK